MPKEVEGVGRVPDSEDDICRCGKCGIELRVCRECRRVFPVKRSDSLFCGEPCKKRNKRRR